MAEPAKPDTRWQPPIADEIAWKLLLLQRLFEELAKLILNNQSLTREQLQQRQKEAEIDWWLLQKTFAKIEELIWNNPVFWERLDEWHAYFQVFRSLTRFTIFAHPNTVSTDYAHPIADQSWLGDIDLGLDENGDASNRAFTILSLLYVAYYLLVYIKIKSTGNDEEKLKKLRETLPSRIRYALFEAKIWGFFNFVAAGLSLVSKLDENLLTAITFGLFAIIMVLDAKNAVAEHSENITKIKVELKVLEELLQGNSDQDSEESKYIKYRIEVLNTDLYITHIRRVISFGFGLVATAGGLCLATSGALSFANITLEAVAHLAFAGAWMLSGAAILFAVARFFAEVTPYVIELIKNTKEIYSVTQEIKTLNPQNDHAQINKLQNKKAILIQRQKELGYEIAKSTVYYTALTLVLAVSLFAGPVAGLCALAAFLVIYLVCKHFEPKIKESIFPKPKEIVASISAKVKEKTQAPVPASTSAPTPTANRKKLSFGGAS